MTMNEIMSTHWAECWLEHHECFWGHCVWLGRKYNTTVEYQAFSLFKMALDDNFYILQGKEVIK